MAKTKGAGPNKLTPSEFNAILQWKGWTKKQVAERWEITPVWVSEIARNPNRPPHWDDCLFGLPNRRFLARNEKRRRRSVLAIVQASGKPDQRGPGFRYRGHLVPGSVVAACEDVGSIAEAGMRGVVVNVRQQPKHEEYQILFQTLQSDWFPPDYVDQLLAATGMTIDMVVSAGSADVDTVADMLDRGEIRLWG